MSHFGFRAMWDILWPQSDSVPGVYYQFKQNNALNIDLCQNVFQVHGIDSEVADITEL